MKNIIGVIVKYNIFPGVDWLELFKNRHLSCQTPEATSLARASAFNEHNVTLFFDKMASVMDRYLMLDVRNIFCSLIRNESVL